MSAVLAESLNKKGWKIMGTFKENFLAGKASILDLDDYVEKWHSDRSDGRSLTEYLGLSTEENSIWLKLGNKALEHALRHDAWRCNWNLVNSDEFSEIYRCSQCGYEASINVEIYREELPNFCPNCGAMSRKETA